MAWTDSKNNMKEMFRKGTPKEIAAYIWCYYKWHICAVVFLLIVAVNILYANITEKEHVLQGFFLNALVEEETAEKLERDYLAVYPIDEGKEDINFDVSRYYVPEIDKTSSYENLELVSVQMIAGSADFAVADHELMTQLAYSGLLCELSEVLPEVCMETYADCFLYYDRAIAEGMRNGDDIPDTYPDPDKPEEMEDPVPIMIDLSGSERVAEFYPMSKHSYAFGFGVQVSNPENARNLLAYLTSRP